MDAKIVSDADADEILSAIGKLEGGEFGPERLRLWKPVVNLSYYEHDDECRVEVANCKGAEVVSTCGHFLESS